MAANYGKWALSPAGRRLAGALALSGAAGSFLAYYLPNTLFLNNFKEVTGLYRDGYTVPVAGKVTSLVDEVMNDLGLSQPEKKKISIYTAYGFDVFHAGSTMVNSGGILGIPVNFKYSSVEEFDSANVTVNNEPVPWSTAEGESLKQSFVLSREAKKFALAREITTLATAKPFVFGTLSAGAVGMVYTMASGVNARMNFYAKPRTLRVILYGMISAFGYAFWVLLKDMATVNYEEDADRIVADISEKYAIGGLEFYEKILQRNMALYKLMGSKGEVLYSAYGNDQVLFRTKHVPFTLRRDYMKSRVEEYKEKGETSANEDTHTQNSSLDIDLQTQSTADTDSQTENSQDVHTQTQNAPDINAETQSTPDIVDTQIQNTSDADTQTQSFPDVDAQTQNTPDIDTETQSSPDIVDTQTQNTSDTGTQTQKSQDVDNAQTQNSLDVDTQTNNSVGEVTQMQKPSLEDL